jgi:peroxiredoxin Q/BCP
VGISTDSVEAQKKFKEKEQLPFPLLSDEGGKVSQQYGGTMPVVGMSNRATFVVGQDGVVKEVITGKDAIDPGGAIAACPLRKPG